MERCAMASARPPPRRCADQPSFSSTLLDVIYKSMDETNPAATTTTPRSPIKKKHQDALHYYYYYKPSLSASCRARAAASNTSHCSSCGTFSASEAEYADHRRRRLSPIRTSVAGGPPPRPLEKAKAKKPAASAQGCRRPASPGARIAGILNSIFSGKRLPTPTPKPPPAAVPECSTAPASYARACLTRTASSSRERASRRTVRFLDIDGAVAVATSAADFRRLPVVEVEEVLLRRADGKESSTASSDLFELENFTVIAPASGGGGRTSVYRDGLPVYETTRAGLRRGIGHSHSCQYGHGRSSRVI